jgi:serine/threonine protein kinase
METTTQGTLVADRYRLIREIGFGGMGTVWLAYDGVLDSQCAIKLIGASQAAEEEFRIRFECEAKCAAQLRGAHVVDVLDRGQWRGKPFIVMEYMDGEDLAMRLERLGRLDVRTTYRIVAQVSRALMRAHTLGIVHRDIKPGNIFLVPGDDHEIAKVLDFGIAKHRALPNAFDDLQSGQFVGTPCYMSPEQASGRAVDWRSDLWALAIITFECLTGTLPFQDDSMPEMVAAITRGPVPKLTLNRPDLPAELEFWWQRATARDPERRFQSAKEFADALAEAIGVYPMAISGFPQASGDAPTLFEPPSLLPPSRPYGVLGRGRAAADSDETDGAFILHSRLPSSEFERQLRARRRRSSYLLAAMALCAGAVLGASAWHHPVFDQVVMELGFAGRDAPPLPPAMNLGVHARELPASAAQLALAPEAVLPAAAVTSTQPLGATEPPVLVVTEPRPALVNSGAQLNKPSPVIRKPNRWRPLAPPANASSAPPDAPYEKDYGI